MDQLDHRENRRLGPYEIDPKYLQDNTEPYDTMMICVYGALLTIVACFWAGVAVMFFG